MSQEADSNRATRRAFLGAATALTAASYNRVLGANDRVGIGFIGYGLIGKQHVAGFLTYDDVDILGMCDCYQPRVDEGLAFIGRDTCKGYTDFRKMYEDPNIDGVVVATPDHWHALLSIMASAAGKDSYVEKPLTIAIDEGKWMIRARDRYDRRVVVGTQRNHNPGLQETKKILESGVLGKIQSVRLGSRGRNVYPGFGVTPMEDPPSNFDYEMWLGPAPKRPYRNHRGLYHFRWFWDYSGGQLTNLGAHSISAFLLYTGVKGPTKVVSFGGRRFLEDDGETPDIQEVLWEFPDFMLTMGVTEANSYGNNGSSVVNGTKGNLLLGSNQILSETHGNPLNSIPRFRGHPVGGVEYDDTPTQKWIPDAPTSREYEQQAAEGGGRGRGGRGDSLAPEGYPGEGTMYLNHRDFINSIRTRNTPLCTLEEGHRTSIICNLGNMSLKLGGRMIQWDPENEVVIGDAEAQAMCHIEYREPWNRELRAIVNV